MNEEKILGFRQRDIIELSPETFNSLTEDEKNEIKNRWRAVKEWEGHQAAVGNMSGLYNVSLKTFLEFRQISKEWFSNSDGNTLAALVHLFRAHEHEMAHKKQTIRTADGNEIEV